MPPVLFYCFAAVMIGFGVLVVTLKNPVSCALSLVVSFLGLAALFLSLDAYFIGIIQILVYGGAVMVLFLFIIMLLDLKSESRRKLHIGALAAGAVLVAGFAMQLIGVLGQFEPGKVTLADRPIAFTEAAALRPPAEDDAIADALRAGSLPDVRLIGENLFLHYTYHLQGVAVLLLVATVGVVILSKRELK